MKTFLAIFFSAALVSTVSPARPSPSSVTSGTDSEVQQRSDYHGDRKSNWRREVVEEDEHTATPNRHTSSQYHQSKQKELEQKKVGRDREPQSMAE